MNVEGSMMDNLKNKNRKFGIKVGPIMSLLIGLSFFTFILFVAFMETGKNKKSSARQNFGSQSSGAEEDDLANYNKPDKNITAIVLETDKTNKTIRLYNINGKEEIVLNFTGASNFLDKYGQAISVDQVEAGLIADIGYQSIKNKIIEFKPSSKAWEYVGVNNMTINMTDKTIKIAKSNYVYDTPVVIDNDKFITMEELAIQDELTVRGIDKTIWSIVVTKGHGTVRLTDCDAFLGGSVSIGYESVQEITENMTVIVREGNYNLTAENGEFSGTKNITVYRNRETVVSLGDLGPKYGQVTFDIAPFGADLFIDGKLTSYANPVKLICGEHSIEVSLGGYATYRGSLKVDSAGKEVQIILPELHSNENVSVVENEENPDGNTGENSDENGNTDKSSDKDSDYIEYNNWDLEQEPGEGYPEEIYVPADEESMNPVVDEEHLIYIQNPKGASVYLNGEYKGISPGSFKKVLGRHVLTFIKQGYQTKSYTIDIYDDGLDTYISLPDLVPDK